MNAISAFALTGALLLSEAAVAADKTFHFGNECENSFRYDPAKYSKQQVENTVKLIFFNR
jgi:hypothetical protein